MNYNNRSINREESIKLIQSNDLVIIYERHNQLTHLYVKQGIENIYQNKYGAFYHDDIIDKPFGSRIYSRSTAGWIYVLEPTPELWSLALNTRTQIVNEVDASIIITALDIYSGCRVVESGTGSGNMTIALARTVYPNGKIYSYEYNNMRAQIAIEEFDKMHLSDVISVQCRDVCGKYRDSEGGFIGIDAQSIDAVFLDLPEPWLAIEHSRYVLKEGRSICCYSPCIEQVSKTCEKLRELGFYDIRMVEVRQRPYDTRQVTVESANLGHESLTNEIKSIDNNSVDETSVSNNNHQSDSEINPPDKRLKINENNKVDKWKAFKSGHLSGYPMLITKPENTIKGHTAFLTFAVRPSNSIIDKINISIS